MRLALLTPEWYPREGGGIATYCRIFAAEAAALGHDVTVLAATQQDHQRQRDVIPVTLPKGASARETATAFRLAWLALGREVDAIEAAEFGGVAAFLAGEVPVITRLHTPLALLLERNGGSPIYPDDRERCELEARQVRASALVTSPTAWLAREAKRLWNVDAQVIPNPCGPDIPVWPETLGRPDRNVWPTHPLRVLYFGRLEHRKGVLTLAEAARPLIERGEIELTLAGDDTKWLGYSVRGRIVQALAPSEARILPPQYGDDLTRLIDEADLVLLPSLFENFAYTCIEAMSRAKCVIATTGSGFDEIIEHGKTGFLVPPYDAAALRDAIAAFPAAPASIGRAARASLKRFEAAKIVPRLLAAYTESAQMRVLDSRP